MTNPTKLLETWNNLKQKLITTLTELKDNHKDKWAVVKFKSKPETIQVLPTHQLEQLKGSLLEKKTLLQNKLRRLNQRRGNELIAPQDQLECDQLRQEIAQLEKTIAWQEWLQKANWESFLQNQITAWHAQQESEKARQDLAKAQDSLYWLNQKLDWVRTLVRGEDFSKLLELVRGGRV